MIPTIHFDPPTLAIWTTTGNLPPAVGQLAAAAMAAAVEGKDPRHAVAELAEDDPLRRRALWLASCVWHEKRHFFDVCLTCYGARRFRDIFNLAANFMPLAAEARRRGEAVWLPVEVYGFRGNRRLGVPEPWPAIAEVARRALALKGFARALDAPIAHADGIFHVGGHAQLEGLAQVSQINAIEYRFGPEEARAVTAEHVHRLPREGPYRAIEAVAGALGCARELPDGSMAVDAGLASALFVTALSGRFFGVGREAPVELTSPSARLIRLADAVGFSARHRDLSDEGAWELVDGEARRLWGRTALEEIESDIDAMEQTGESMSAAWLAAEGLANVWTDFVVLRRRLLAAVQAAGPASLSPRAFPLLWLDSLLPWHIVATPGGEFEEASAPIVFGRGLTPPPGLESVLPKLVVWGRLHEPAAQRAAHGFAVRDRAAWLQMLERHAPRARLMLNGRCHRLMIPPEFERPIAEMEALGVSVRFDPMFEWPQTRDRTSRAAEALELAAWSGRETFVCDVTGTEIAPADAEILTPWEFRRSPLVSRFRAEIGEEAAVIADLRLGTDWSDWIVRRGLLSD